MSPKGNKYGNMTVKTSPKSQIHINLKTNSKTVTRQTQIYPSLATPAKHRTLKKQHQLQPKIPSNILLGSDWRKVAKKLMTTKLEDFLQVKVFGEDKTKIQLVKHFRIGQRYLTVTETEFHTFSFQPKNTQDRYQGIHT